MDKTEITKIPQLELIMNDPMLSEWTEKISRHLLSAAVKSAINFSREKIKTGHPYSKSLLYSNINKLCTRLYNRRIQSVINATGVILHPNMGRSPILPEVWEQCSLSNTGYSNLELSLKTGKTEKKNGLIPHFINLLTGAEGCSIVNNNAAAIHLVLSAFAAGKEVIVSRGEQVQIGGGFRIPELLRLSGVIPVEVGTTNITTLKDYLDAITENTAMILKVHRSSFAVRGFTSEPAMIELSSALPDNIILVADQGSGIFNENLPGETTVAGLITDGADLVTFSGDKIIGGPQAGIIAGREDLVRIIEQHPLMRTLRPGKTISSLLETTLLHRINTESASSRHMEHLLSSDGIREKCKKLKRGISADKFKLTEDRISIGEGCTADQVFNSWAVEIVSDKMKAESIIKLLRESEIPVIGAIRGNRAVINPATLNDDEIKYVKSVLKQLENLL